MAEVDEYWGKGVPFTCTQWCTHPLSLLICQYIYFSVCLSIDVCLLDGFAVTFNGSEQMKTQKQQLQSAGT